MKEVGIDINLATRRGIGGRAARAVALALFAAALVFTGCNIYEYHRAGASISRLGEHLQVLEKRPYRERPAVSKYADPKLLEKDVEFINGVIFRRALSWSGLLTDLEACVPHNIQVLQVTPVFERKSVTIGARARRMSDILAMVESMVRSKRFRDAFLLRHSADSAGTVLFTISARYSMEDGE